LTQHIKTYMHGSMVTKTFTESSSINTRCASPISRSVYCVCKKI